MKKSTPKITYLALSLLMIVLISKPGQLNAQETAKAADKVEIAKDILETYVGEYKMGKDTLKIMIQGNDLKAKGPGHPPLEMKPLKENRFFLRRFGVDIEFVKGDDGKIAKLLMIREDGQSLEAPKVG